MLNDLANDAEQREEDGHLQQNRQAATQRIELVLGVELGHLALQRLGIVLVAFLKLLHLWLQHLHLCGRARGFRHKRHDEQSHDERKDDDRQAPVATETVDADEDVGHEFNKCVP